MSVGCLRSAIQLKYLVRPIGVTEHARADRSECVADLHRVPPLTSIRRYTLRRVRHTQDPAWMDHSMAGQRSSVGLHSPDICVEQQRLLLTVAVEAPGDGPQAVTRLHVVQHLVLDL